MTVPTSTRPALRRDLAWAASLLCLRHPLAARRWLGAVIGLGLLFGLGQTLRGAHYPSHTLWTAWICLALTLASYHGWHAWRRG